MTKVELFGVITKMSLVLPRLISAYRSLRGQPDDAPVVLGDMDDLDAAIAELEAARPPAAPGGANADPGA